MSALTLGITTSGPTAAAVIGDGGVERAAASSAQALDGLLECVRAALDAAGVGIECIGRIAVCAGPGSFTGLRIGVAFAKSVAQARGIAIAGVSAYDVAEAGASDDAYPRASVVEGKRSYYYARIVRALGVAPEFHRGDRAAIDDALRGVTTAFALADVPPVEQALRVARIGGRAPVVADGWRGLEIDYGQRPNAVANWEARRGARERGGAVGAANLEEA